MSKRVSKLKLRALIDALRTEAYTECDSAHASNITSMTSAVRREAAKIKWQTAERIERVLK